MTGRALDGLQVVEVGRRFAASYATKLMADLGASVVKIEEPAGDPVRMLPPFAGGQPHPEKSGAFLYLNCNKQGVTLDTTGAPGRAVLDRLLTQTDILVHDLKPEDAEAAGLAWDRVHSVNPRMIMTSVTPFGLNGPYRDFNAYDLTLASAGGWTTVNGQPLDPTMPPLRAFGHQTAFQAGVNAALATMGAAVWRLKSGKGQHVEVSAQECISSILELTYVTWPYMGLEVVRYGQRPLHPIDFFECKDGWIFVLCLEEKQWRSFLEMMGNPEWGEWEVFANAFVRASNWDALKPFIAEFVAGWTVDDLYLAAQEKRIPFAPVSTMADLLDSPHLNARGFFAEITHPAAGTAKYPGAPYKLMRTPWEIRSPAPTLGQHNEAVLGGLGLGTAEIDALRASGVTS
ncbi:MAG TPA: CoA transferase [Dehalococcoidia bacterium]|nr:CoA transferase [Dehalococcoidia bacterium]